MKATIKRYRPVILAVTVGVFFLTSILTFNDSLWRTTESSLQDAFGGYTYIASTPARNDEQNPLNNELRQSFQKINGVQDVQPSVNTIGFVQRGTVMDHIRLRSMDWLGKKSLTSGTYPKSDTEVVIDASVASKLNIKMGDSLSILSDLDDTHALQVRVTGLVRAFGLSMPGNESIYGGVDTINKIHKSPPDSYSNVLIKATQSRDVLQGLQAVPSSTNEPVVITPVKSFTQEESTKTLPGVQYIQMGTIGAAICAFLVLVVVIRSVFGVRVEEDRRDYSLRRCFGATRQQIFLSVLGGAATVGVISSALGEGLCFLIAAAVLAIPAIPLSFGVTTTTVVIGLLAGTLICVVGAIEPARQAMKNTALDALRNVRESGMDMRPLRHRVPWKRSGALVLACAGLFVFASRGIMPGVIGCAAFIVIFGLSLMNPITRDVASIVLKIRGLRRYIPLNEAMERIRMRSTRASSISGLTAITVSFIVIIASGSASAFTSFDKTFNSTVLPDVSMSFDNTVSDPQQILRSVQSVDSVKKAVIVETREVDMNIRGETLKNATIIKITPELRQVVHAPFYLENVKTGTVFLGKEYNVGDGDRLTLGGPSGSRPFTADVRDGGNNYAFVTASDFDDLTGPTKYQVWVDLTPDSDAKMATSQVVNALSGNDVSYKGTAQQLAEIKDFLAILNLVALLMSFVGVLIALVGISNTLRVSLMERTQEIGLQRALGELKTDIRSSVVEETLVLTLLGALLGGGAGALIGVTGVYALSVRVGDLKFSPDIPLGFLAAILTVTVLVGVCSSLFASRRAMKISPVQAIASQ